MCSFLRADGGAKFRENETIQQFLFSSERGQVNAKVSYHSYLDPIKVSIKKTYIKEVINV